MSASALAILAPTVALATVEFLPGSPLQAQFRQIRVAGPVGPDGPSAYDVAVAQGFTGTEADWLASLQAGSVTAVAAVALSGHRTVLLDTDGKLAYPSLSAADDGGQIIGITVGATAQGSTAVIRTEGLVTEPSWSWSRGPVFAGDNGVLTQMPPDGAWVRQIGVASSPTSIFINLQPVILT